MKAWKTLITFTVVLAFSFAIPCSAYADALVSVPDITGSPGASIVIPINIDDATDVAGAEIDLVYDPDILIIPQGEEGVDAARTTSLTAGFSIIANTNTPGRIIITAASLSALSSGSGALVEIWKCTVSPDAPPCSSSPLTLESVKLFDNTPAMIPGTTTQDGTFELLPSAEICDGLDNDCDGVDDNGDPGGGAACDTGLPGVCAAGTEHCVGGSIQCEPDISTSAEICDGLDNDCDPATADGADEPWLDQSCDGADSDLCKEGVYECFGGNQNCTDVTEGNLEICDGLDNDCDEATDEDLTAPLCSLQNGVCAGSIKTCGGAPGWLDCGGADYGSDYEASEESCDGLDNDCNGEVDDDADTDGDGIYDCLDDDDDNDGMPDAWELLYPTCLDPLVKDAGEDCDTDGYSNYVEYLGGSDPTNENSVPDALSKTFNLEIGLNAISLPFEGTGYTTAEELGQAITGCSAVARWDAVSQSYQSHDVGSGGDGFGLIVGEAYFVTVDAASSFVVTGLPPSGLQFSLITTLTTDLNDISMPYDVSGITTAEELGQAITGCQVVSRWDATTQSYQSHVVGFPDVNNFPVAAGEAYFVAVSADVVWP